MTILRHSALYSAIPIAATSSGPWGRGGEGGEKSDRTAIRDRWSMEHTHTSQSSLQRDMKSADMKSAEQTGTRRSGSS